MTTAVETIDFDAIYAEIKARQDADKKRRIQPPLVRLWDGDWNLRGYVKNESNAKFQFLNNDTGTAQFELPIDNYLAKWLVDVDGRSTTQVHLTMDKDGARWSGALSELSLVTDDSGHDYVRATFLHDYEHMKHILVYSNPFAGAPALNWVGAPVRDLYSFLPRYNFRACGSFLAQRVSASKLHFYVI